MTGPIVWDPIPTPELTDPCDGVLAWRDVALPTDRNFAKIRDYDVTAPSVVLVTALQTAKTPNYVGTVASYFPVPSFPLCTITLPDPVSAVMVTLSGHMYALGSANTIEMSAILSGTGLTATQNPSTATQLAARNFKLEGTRTWIIERGSLIAGGEITMQAVAKYSCTATTYIQTGGMRLLALKGW